MYFYLSLFIPLDLRDMFRFTVRNVTVNNAQSGIFSVWNWGKSQKLCAMNILKPALLGWTYQGVTINNCQAAFDVSTGGMTTGTQVCVHSHIFSSCVLTAFFLDLWSSRNH